MSGGREDKYVCPYEGCHREFHKRWSLTRHFRTHTGEKPFRCSKCNKEFIEKCGLIRHEQTHTDERQWECDIGDCRKRFKLKEYLDIHKKTWHAKNEVGTNCCDFSFRSLQESLSSKDTTEQLRQRLVRMSLRHRELDFQHKRKEAALEAQIREYTELLQAAVGLLQSSQESPNVLEFLERARKRLSETGKRENEGSIDSVVSGRVSPSKRARVDVQQDLEHTNGYNGISIASFPSEEDKGVEKDGDNMAPGGEKGKHSLLAAMTEASRAIPVSALPSAPPDDPIASDQPLARTTAGAVFQQQLREQKQHHQQKMVGLTPKIVRPPPPVLGAGENVADIMAWIQSNPHKTRRL
mmetsp:Transcript_23931/g.35132  ORF Transcript_23931/g.35132 Transcript_23931/m.35132 type:complete len:353 (+) Transcript_23931:93-1151(+)